MQEVVLVGGNVGVGFTCVVVPSALEGSRSCRTGGEGEDHKSLATTARELRNDMVNKKKNRAS